MTLPAEGERVTVVISHGFRRFHHGTVLSPTELPDGRAFTVKFEEPNMVDGDEIHLWSFDPAFVEGIGWARGWDGPAVDALKAVEALT